MTGMDDERLMAYLDGELGPAERAEVERALEGDAQLRSRLETQRRLQARLAAHYGPVAQEEVPERFRRLLGANVVGLSAERERRRRPLWQGLAALAATLVLGFFLGRLVTEPGPVAVRDGVMVADGALAEALDTQLAAGQGPEATVRIGVSFARADGSFCRTFESASLSGLACREGPAWQMVVTAAGDGAQQGQYRQAGSEGALALQAAQEMMAGEPLDAQAERRARDSGWR